MTTSHPGRGGGGAGPVGRREGRDPSTRVPTQTSHTDTADAVGRIDREASN